MRKRRLIRDCYNKKHKVSAEALFTKTERKEKKRKKRKQNTIFFKIRGV